ncbi:hypothetical protein LPJ59_004516 [Coemansia sp. RSA 2399]|nr:hypothetical protein LPJ59_004516 [Coemansia sp. RSA 2399]
MRRILAKAAPVGARRLAQAKRSTYTAASDERSDISKAMRQLETDSGPTQEQQGIGLMQPEVDALRQRVHSSMWVKQLVSGTRQCTFSQLTKPKDLLIRVKPKHTTTTAQKGNAKRTKIATILSVDELHQFSTAAGKSQYLPATATGMFAAATDPATRHMMADSGWVRPDIVEHCSRVLRLRIVSDMHRACCEYAAHAANRPHLERPLAIPAKGTTFKVQPSRLDVIRMDVTRRIMLQDALWQPPSACPFIAIDDCTGDVVDIQTVLPAAGLHCIVKVPAAYAAGASVLPCSVSSESSARAVWAELRRIAGNVEENPPEETADLLAERSWPAFRLTGRPHTLNAPTFGAHALDSLYGLLPRLTPESMYITAQTSTSSSSSSSYSGMSLSKRVKKKQKQAMELAITSYLKATQSADSQKHGLCSDATISFRYSLVRPGTPFAPADGSATKTVPLYDASAILGNAIAATVVPWLLHLPLASTDASASTSPRYVGIVALPCTAQLATQFHRLATYATQI